MLRKVLLAAAASERVRDIVLATPATRALTGRYVAGESIEDAVATARALRAGGLLVTLDYLGDGAADAADAAATAAQYVALLGKLAADGLTEDGAVEVSVKPTALGLYLGSEGSAGPNPVGERIASEHLERIAAAALDAGTTLTIDAEDHESTDARLRITGAIRSHDRSVGTVLQAALRRTESDVRALAADGVRVRLCKGAYTEPVSEAFDSGHDIDKSFARCLRILMAGSGYPMIATHDPRLIAIARSLGFARQQGSFEYQMLYGVRPDEQRRLAGEGAKVRVYAPYGSDWYPYLVRRLAERPASLALFLRSLRSRS